MDAKRLSEDQDMGKLKTIAAAALALFAAFGAASGAEAQLKAGAAAADITPDLGCYLGGYYHIFETAKGVHDPLHSRILALSQGDETVLLIANELIMTGGVFAIEIKERIEKEYGVPPRNVMITAGHTHAGPEGYYEEFGKYPKEYNPEMKKKLQDKITAAAGQALAAMEPARAGTAFISLEGYSRNRRISGGTVDPLGLLLVVKALDGRPIGGFLNFSAHPTIVNAGELLISSDWLGTFSEEMSKAMGGGVFLFIQGANGDISPAGGEGADGWERARSYGAKLAAATSSNIESVSLSEDFPVGGAMREMIFPVRTMKSMGEFRAAIPEKTEIIRNSDMSESEKDDRIKMLQARLGVESFIMPLVKTMSRVKGGRTRTWVQALRLGDAYAVTLPGEPVADVGLQVRESLAPMKTALFGYANDHLAYISTRKIYEEGGYEAGMGLVFPEATEEMMAAGAEMAVELSKK